MTFDDLPGGDLLVEGLADLASGELSEAALLVAIGAERLSQAGVDVPRPRPSNPEHALYDRLATEHGDGAHSRYNALLRRLTSLGRALEARSHRA